MTNMSCSDLFPAFWGNASMQSLELAEDRTNQMLRRSISAWAFCSWCCSAPDFVPKVSTLKLVWKVYFQSPLCHGFNIFQLSHFGLVPFSRFYVRLCARELVWNLQYRYQWDSISSFHIMQTALSPRTPQTWIPHQEVMKRYEKVQFLDPTRARSQHMAIEK